jgi:RNA polymerase-interacting CarD/CdnL/TRCF family regulator
MARLRTVLTAVLVAMASACASVPPPPAPEPEPLVLAELVEGELAALPPLGVVLVRGRAYDEAGTVVWELANEMKTLRIPEGALGELGLRRLASPGEVAWARHFLAHGVDVDGAAAYDARRAMGWMETMRSGRFADLVTTFGVICAVAGERELQAVEKSLLDTARVWLVAELSSVDKTPPDVADDWLRSVCAAL